MGTSSPRRALGRWPSSYHFATFWALRRSRGQRGPETQGTRLHPQGRPGDRPPLLFYQRRSSRVGAATGRSSSVTARPWRSTGGRLGLPPSLGRQILGGRCRAAGRTVALHGKRARVVRPRLLLLAQSASGWVVKRVGGRRPSPGRPVAVSVKPRSGRARRGIRFQCTSAPFRDRFRSRPRRARSPARGRGPGPRRGARAARPRQQPLAVSRVVHARSRLSFLAWHNFGCQGSLLAALAPSRANRRSGVGLPPT